MTDDEEAEIISLIRAAQAQRRGYADFFGWAPDRNVEEWGVATTWRESLEADGKLFFTSLKARGRGNDPPDCEARNEQGARLAIEVTELVDGEAIRAFKAGRVYDWATWTEEQFIAVLTARITRKDVRLAELKDPPYDGGHVLLLYTAEPMLSAVAVEDFLAGRILARPAHIDRTFLLLAYDPALGRCPYFELAFGEGHSSCVGGDGASS